MGAAHPWDTCSWRDWNPPACGFPGICNDRSQSPADRDSHMLASQDSRARNPGDKTLLCSAGQRLHAAPRVGWGFLQHSCFHQQQGKGQEVGLSEEGQRRPQLLTGAGGQQGQRGMFKAILRVSYLSRVGSVAPEIFLGF